MPRTADMPNVAITYWRCPVEDCGAAMVSDRPLTDDEIEFGIEHHEAAYHGIR